MASNMSIDIMAEDVYRVLDKIIDLETHLLPVMETLNDALLEDVEEYPPERNRQTYVRTMDLQNSWEDQLFVGSNELVGIVESLGVEYAEWVKDDAQQSWVHRGRHRTTLETVERQEDFALDLFTEHIQLLIK